MSFGNTSYTIPANSLTVGYRDVIVGIGLDRDISNAAYGSWLTIAGFNYVPITIGIPDLVIVDIYEDAAKGYLYVKYENIGTGASNQDFLIKLSSAKGEFPGNPNYRFPVPEPGVVMETGGFGIGLIGMTGTESAEVTAEIDWEGRVNELNDNNNTLTKMVGP
jgi:hypothetical protein